MRAGLRGVGAGVVLRRDLHHIAAADVQAFEAVQNGQRFAGAQATDLRGSGAGCEDRVQAVDIERHIGRAIAHYGAGHAHDFGNTQCGYLLGMHHRHADIFGKLPQVFRRTADTDLDAARRVQHAVEHRQPERPAVVETGLVKRASGIAVRVDMHHAQRLRTPQGFHDRVGDGMVAAYSKRQHALVGHAVVPGLQVFDAHGQAVAAAKGYIAHIGHTQTVHGRDVEHMVVGADALDGTQRTRPEARAGPVAGTQIHRRAHQRHLQIAKVRVLCVHGAVRCG